MSTTLTFYVIRNTKTKLYYRLYKWPDCAGWFEFKDAKSWTNRSQAKAKATALRNQGEPVELLECVCSLFLNA